MSEYGGEPQLVPASTETPTKLGRFLGFELNVLLPGMYAWATTLALPAASPRAPGLTRVAALIAFLSLCAGPFIVRKHPLLGRIVGIQLFVLTCVLGWIWLDRAGLSLFGRSTEAVFGGIGWMLFAFGWGDLRARRGVPETDPRVLPGPTLFPRSVLSRSVEFTLGLAVAGALLLGLLAWNVSRQAHAVMAHTAAVLLGLSLVGVGARVALDRGQRRHGTVSERVNTASTSLAILLIALGLGALYWMLER